MVDGDEIDACKRGEARTVHSRGRECVLAENLVDSYIQLTTSKDLWEALEAEYGVFDAGSE